MKMTDGCLARATAKSAFTIFSPSPIHLDMRLDAEMEKKVEDESVAIALAINVLPVPGGPKSSRPFGGRLAPTKSSGRRRGRTVISVTDCFAKAKPAIESQLTPGERSTTSVRICSTRPGSTPRRASCSSRPSSTSTLFEPLPPPSGGPARDVPPPPPPPPPPP